MTGEFSILFIINLAIYSFLAGVLLTSVMVYPLFNKLVKYEQKYGEDVNEYQDEEVCDINEFEVIDEIQGL